MAELLALFDRFQWLRPWWLLALLPAAAVALALHRHRAGAGDWARVIAPALLPWLLEERAVSRQRHLPWIALAAWTIAALALAGPSWRDLPRPVYRSEQPLVILFDLSPAMLAQDLKPDRLTRARLKLMDLLAARHEGTTALVAYAGDAHVVTPLSDDARTLAALAPALTPDLMPMAGNAPEAALAKALELLANVGERQGDVLLITAGVDQESAATMTAQLAAAKMVRLSILAVGTAAGAPAPLPGGGFARDRTGNLLLARLESRPLQALARDGGGRYLELSTDGRDVQVLTQTFAAQARERTRALHQNRDTRRDEGPWLVLLLLPFALGAWRRGFLAMLLVTPLLVGAPTARALEWSDLWLRADQRGQQALDAGDAAAAQKLFTDPARRGTAAYRAGDLGTAAAEFGRRDDAGAHYNRGNALARSGDYGGAIAAYDRALELDPRLADAAFNRDLVQRAEQQRKQQTQQSGQNGQNGQNGQQDRNQPPQDGTDSESTDTPTDGRQASPGKGGEGAQPDREQPGQGKPDAGGEQTGTPRADQSAGDKPAQDRAPEHGKSTAAPPADDNAAAKSGSDTAKPGADDAGSAARAPGAEAAGDGISPARTAPGSEETQLQEQQLRVLPDDPGGLLRRKFYYERQQREERGAHPAMGEQRW